MSKAVKYPTKKWLLLLALQCFAIVFAQAQFNPSEVDGLQLWLRADSGIVFNGNYISQWSDLSGNNRHATSSVDVIRPTLTSQAINNRPAVTFDGLEDFLEFPEIGDVRTVFWIIREHPEATANVSRPLLGWSGGLNFLRGDNQFLFNPQYAAPQVFNGTTRLNGSVVNSGTTLLNPGFNMVSLVTTGNVQASHLTMELNIYGRTWWGDMAEVLIYNTPLSNESMSEVEAYLRERYAPAYTAMEDIDMGEILCDTLLCIPSDFTNVVWDNTIESNCLLVSNSGLHTVTFTDSFERSYHDTIQVHYAVDHANLEEIFCTGEFYTWPSTESTFGLMWNGENINEVISNQAGLHTLVVTDTEGCSKTVEIQLSEDTFESQYAIAPQEVYCAGAVLQVLPPLPQEIIPLWNGVGVQSGWTLNQNGEYTVEATNSTGCVMRDTIDVVLAGSSSVVLLTAQGQCVGTSVAMNTLVQQGDNIISGTWQFGDGATVSASSVDHTYSAPGSYEVEFIGSNAVGCQSYASMEVVIHALPTISFDSQGQCSNAPIALHAVASSLDGAISTIDWLVGGQFYQGENIEVDLSTPGWNNVIVAATTYFGCTAEWSELYEIFAPPLVNAEIDSVCHGSLSQGQWQLVASGTTSSVVSVAWDFGDGTGSLQQQPFHFYTYPGTYDLRLTTVNSAGCTDTTNLIGLVYANPEADFLITNFCEQEEKELIDMSDSDAEDPITQWLWSLDGTTDVQGQQPLVSFNGQGLHPVMLTVTTQHGCVGEVLQQIPVWPTPAVSFTWDPLISGAPWQVPFVANASLPCDFSWYFGDGSNGQGGSSPHLYGMNGTYNVQMTGTTSQGCSETYSQIITVADPVIDVAITGFQLTPAEEGNKIQVQLRNNGNIKLNEVMMSWQLGGNAPVIENWTIGLGAGESGVFDFESRVLTLGAVYPYICVNAETSPWIATEQNLTDNAYCKPLETGGLELFSPYPNPGDDRMFVRLMAPQNGIMNMRVFDNKGQQVMVFEELDVSKGFQQFFIDISELTNGTYKLVAEMADAKSVVSFMKIAR